jgi:hypothetical protein
MADKRKSQPTQNRESEKQRPRGKTGRDDTFRDTERARAKPMKAARDGTSAATTAVDVAKPAKKALRAASNAF